MPWDLMKSNLVVLDLVMQFDEPFDEEGCG